MAEETTEASNREQLVMVLRHVDATLTPLEEFISLGRLTKIDSDTLTQYIQDCLVRSNVSINNCRRQHTTVKYNARRIR